jgi:hypothetical protein
LRRLAAIAGVALIAGTWAGCARRTETVASRYIKSVRVVASRGASIAVTREESAELAGTALDISADALAEDTVITLELGYEPILSAPAEVAGDVALWGPEGTTFLVPARMKLPYRLGTERASDLYVERLQGSGARQRFDQPSLTVDPTARLATLMAPGLSSFQVGAHASGARPPDGGARSDGPEGHPSPRDAQAEDASSAEDLCAQYCSAVHNAIETNGCAPVGSCLGVCASALESGSKCPAETAQLLDCGAGQPPTAWQCSPTSPGVALEPGACVGEQSALQRCLML